MLWGAPFCPTTSADPDGPTPLCAGTVDQLQHHGKNSLPGAPGPSSEAVNFLPDKQRWQPRRGGSCTWLLSLSTRDCRRINPRQWMHIAWSWLFTACSRTGGLLSSRRTSALPPRRLESKKWHFFFFGCSDRGKGFLSSPGGVQNRRIWRSFAPLMLYPVQNTTKAQSCPRVAMAALPSMQAAAGVEGGCVSWPAFSPLSTASAAQHPSKYIFIKWER